MSRFAPVLLVLVTACGADASSDSNAWVATTDTVGDTIIVRTESGRAWEADPVLVEEVRIGAMDGDEAYVLGEVTSVALSPGGELYVLDRQVPVVRVYDAAGQHLRDVGGPGGGPGEFKDPGALTFLPDGSWFVVDQGNARLNVYGPDDAYVRSVPRPPGFYTSTPPHADDQGNLYLWVVADRDSVTGMFSTGLEKLNPAFEPVDTVRAPDYGYEAPQLVARNETNGNSSVSFSTLPFSPGVDWTLTRAGHVVSGLSSAYALRVDRPDGPLRIEKSAQPVPVAAAEASERRARLEFSMRRTQPDWRWDGPDIPETKPFFSDIFTDVDGRIWVKLHTEGHQIEAEEPDPSVPPEQQAPPRTWREHQAWDVFESDGRYLGRVEAPDGFELRWAGGDLIYGTESDDLGVPYVVGYRVSFGAGEAPPE